MENQRVVLEILPNSGTNNGLPAPAVDEAKRIIHDAFQRVNQNYGKHKRDAFESMERRLSSAPKELKLVEKKGRGIVNAELPGKDEKSRAARAAQYKDLTPQWKHEVYDPIFKKYEQERFFGTMIVGMTLGSLLSDIKINLAAVTPDPMEMGYISEKNTTLISVGTRLGLGAVNVARIYRQEARFKRIYEGKEDLPDVFEHRGNNRHYVRDRYGIFIPRFLIRNLSANDDELLKAGLQSRDGRTPNSNSAAFIEGVVRHLRAAQQGGSYFISTTSTSKHIYGSTGANFYSPQTGQVLIDAAVIPQDNLVDVHSPMAMAQILGVEEYDWTLEFSEDDDSYQAMAAARDAIRTREIVVHESIPNHAVARIRALNLGIMEWTTPCCYATHGIPTDPSINQRLPSFAK
jgi:hypothetical protein